MPDDHLKLVTPPQTEAEKPVAHDTDIFDNLDSLRVDPELLIRRRQVLTTCAVGRPPANQYFRVSTDPRLSMREVALIRHKQDRDVVFFVPPSMVEHPIVRRHIRLFDMFLTCCWPGLNWMLWPVVSTASMSVTDKPIQTDVSQRAALALAQTYWVNLTWDSQKRDFVVTTAESNQMIEPEWPREQSLSDFLKLAFSGRVLDTPGHEYVAQLRGFVS
jgi:hypothetical protein